MLKTFISYYRRHLGLFILDMGSATSLAVINLMVPYIVGLLIDDMIPNGNKTGMITLSVLILVLALLSPLLTFIVSYFGHVMGTKIERDMRIDLFKHFQKMDSKFFTNKRIGELMSRLIGDLRDISEFAHHGPEDLFISLIMLIGSLAVLFTVSWLLTAVIFIILVLTLIFAGSRRKKMSKAFANTRKYQADLNSQTENSLSGVSVTKSYTSEEYEINRFSNSSLNYQRSWGGAYFQAGVFSSVVTLGIKLMLALTLVIGTYLAANKTITPGQLATFILYISFFTAPIKSLMSFVDQYQKGWSGFSRFYEMLQVKDEVITGDKEFKSVSDKIEFKGIEFRYDHDTKILSDFTLDIHKNESVAIVGKTGVGKSTIAKLIPRFYDVTKGQILIDGVDIKDYSIKSLRGNVGYVEQDSYIFFGTIKDNILYGDLDATDEELIEAAKKASLDEFVNELPNKYDTIVGDRGIKLSGGQKQRISLARIFLKNPSVLVLDEATSALDNKTELAVQRSIEKLSENRTSLIIAHRLTTIENCDKICLVDENGISEMGTHEQLMSLKGKYFDMYTSAIKQGKTLMDS